jgi:phage shock protein E
MPNIFPYVTYITEARFLKSHLCIPSNTIVMTQKEIIQKKLGTVVDVRSVTEFNGGHIEHAINIPLQQIEARLDELKTLTEPLILCCASGGRSGQAHHYLSQIGLECYNGGGWLDVEYIQQQTI